MIARSWNVLTVLAAAYCVVAFQLLCHRYGRTASVIGIHFQAGGAFPFFKLPVDELHNQHVGLDDLWERKPAC